MIERDEAAAAIIERLEMQPHPEGGWYREMWRAPVSGGERAAGSAILFLLESHERSHWHKVDGDEHWFWHAGAPLMLSVGLEGETPRDIWMGGDVLAGQAPQALVPAHHWQATRPLGGWVLVSCTVIPGFEFAGFTLAPPDWTPERG